MTRWLNDPEGWVGALDPRGRVGRKHHVVPRFLLKRWANTSGQVRVFSRADSGVSLRSIADVAIRDFYTFVDVTGSSNSTYEDLLAKIEESAANCIALLSSPFRSRGIELTAQQRGALDTFVAFQVVRGPRSRRELEQLGDYYYRTLSEGSVPQRDLDELEFVTPKALGAADNDVSAPLRSSEAEVRPMRTQGTVSGRVRARCPSR